MASWELRLDWREENSERKTSILFYETLFHIRNIWKDSLSLHSSVLRSNKPIVRELQASDTVGGLSNLPFLWPRGDQVTDVA